MIDKKNVLICGFPNTVLRIFIEFLSKSYNIYFISYSKKFQYSKIKEILGENAFLIDIDSAKNVLRKLYNVFRLILISFKVASNKKTKIFIAYHNHFIKNGIIMLIMKWFFPRLSRIYFPYDIISYAYQKENKYLNKSKLSFLFDRICFEKSDKTITKGSEGELKHLAEIYKIDKKPHFVFNFLIEQKDIIVKKEKKLDLNKINLVFIGGIANPARGDNNYIVFKELLKEKKIALHIYSHTSDLLNDLKHNDNLIIHDYIKDHSKLITEISKYDFGITLSKPSEHVFLQLKMSSGVRLYDYLTAGLPIIIDSEHTLMANIISKNNFGIVISINELKSIVKYINECDYASLILSVNKNREKYFVDKNIDKLITFLDC